MKNLKFFSMIALALCLAIVTGCGKKASTDNGSSLPIPDTKKLSLKQ